MITLTTLTRYTAQSPGPDVRALARRVCHDSLLRNSMCIMGTTVVTASLGYVYWSVATHVYAPHDVGLGAALIAVMTLAANLSNIGMGSPLVQNLPRRMSGRPWSLTLNATMATGLVTGILAGLMVGLVLPLCSHQFALLGQNTALLGIFVVGVPLWTLAALLDALFVAERAATNMLIHNTVYAVLKIPMLVVPVVLARVDVVGILASWVLAAGAASMCACFLIPRLGRRYCLTVRGIGQETRSTLSSLAGHHFINVGGMATMYTVPILVTVRLSATANAYWYTTWMLASSVMMISPAVSTALFAEGSHRADELVRTVRASGRIIAGLLMPAIVAFFLFGHIVMGIFGPNYVHHGWDLFVAFLVASIPDAITNVAVSVMRVQRRLRTAAALNVGMVVITLALSWMLLPVMGILGGGVAWLIAQTTGSVIVAVDLIRLYQRATRATSRPEPSTPTALTQRARASSRTQRSA